MALSNSLAKQLEEQGRYILATGVVDGRRVLDIGRGYANGLLALAESGAAALHVRSDDPRALQTALDEAGLEGVQVTGAAAWPLPYASGAFDLVICHDLAGRMAQDPAWLDELRRVLAPEGYLITAVANPQGQFISELFGDRYAPTISYQDMVGQLQPHFGAVTVFGQSPLAASLFFDFEDTSEETGLTLDRSLLPDTDEQPGWYIVVLGPEPYHRDDLCIVQLPFDTMVGATDAVFAQAGAQAEVEEEEQGEERAEEAAPIAAQPAAPVNHAALETAERVIRTLETELHMARAQVIAAQDAWLRDKPKDDPATQTALTQAQSTITKLERQLVGSQDVVAHLEVDLAGTRRQLKEAQAAATAAQEAAQNAQGLEALQLKVQTLEAEATVLRQDQARLAEMDRELTRSRNDRASFEAQIRDLLEEVTALRQSEESMRNDLQAARDSLQGASAQAARDRAQLEHEQARLAAELAQAQAQAQQAQTQAQEAQAQVQAQQASQPQGMGAAVAAPAAPLARSHDSIGRELDTAVEELEDLLKDVAPPISSGR